MLSKRTNVSRLVTLGLTVAAAAVFTTTASAMFDSSNSQSDLGITQQNATSGGVTPTDLARAVPRESSVPAGVTPTDLARAVPRHDEAATQVTKSAKSDPIWSVSDRNLALGFGLGLALAMVLSLALVTSRRRIRIAHS